MKKGHVKWNANVSFHFQRDSTNVASKIKGNMILLISSKSKNLKTWPFYLQASFLCWFTSKVLLWQWHIYSRYSKHSIFLFSNVYNCNLKFQPFDIWFCIWFYDVRNSKNRIFSFTIITQTSINQISVKRWRGNLFEYQKKIK